MKIKVVIELDVPDDFTPQKFWEDPVNAMEGGYSSDVLSLEFPGTKP